MKNLLIVLVVVAVVVLLAGALNHETTLSFSYLAGETPPVSLAWVALGVAAAIVLAGVAGWAVAAAAGLGARRKLEKELEATYRRLREYEARVPAVPAPPVPPEATPPVQPAPALDEATSPQPAPSEAVTAAQPAADAAVTVTQPSADEPADDARPAPALDADDGGSGRPAGAPADD